MKKQEAQQILVRVRAMLDEADGLIGEVEQALGEAGIDDDAQGDVMGIVRDHVNALDEACNKAVTAVDRNSSSSYNTHMTNKLASVNRLLQEEGIIDAPLQPGPDGVTILPIDERDCYIAEELRMAGADWAESCGLWIVC